MPEARAVREARVLGAAVLLALVTLLVAGPTPTRALAELAGPPVDDPLAPVAPAAALIAWALACWLGAAVAAVTAGHLPGRVGRWATRLAARLAPSTVRRVAQLALGLTLATGAVAAPAGAETTHPAPVAVSLDWPVAPPRTVAPALDWPVAAPPAPPPPLAAAPEEVVVRPGDTLWGLAAAQLPPGATDAAIARAWPAWWSTNRAVIGTDPDLLHPGTRLVPPPSTPR